MKRYYIFCLLLFYSLAKISSAQCVQMKIPMMEIFDHSDLVMKGKVAAAESFIDQSTGNIYTEFIVEVLFIVKGNDITNQISIIERGGIVGMKAEVVSPSMNLHRGVQGVFYLTHSDHLKSNSYQTYAGVQGFILIPDSEIPPHPGTESTRNQIPSITSFSPLVITAGTESVLTINGSSFGNTQGLGYVSFSNANDAGATFNNVFILDYYVSWSDNQIQVKVPASFFPNGSGISGTGLFKVTDNNGVSTTSADPVYVKYARSELVTNNFQIQRQDLIDTNSVGGYTFQIEANTADESDLVHAYKRALTTWRCETLINYELGGATVTDVMNRDGVNVVRFDNGSELPSGTLAISITYLTGCGNGFSEFWWVDEVDQTFDDVTDWNYGPGNPTSSQYDFESVALHELGHAYMQGHVNNVEDVMYYSKDVGQVNRWLIDSTNVECGQLVLSQSISGNEPCAPPHMIPIQASECSLIVTSSPEAILGAVILIYPNPFTDKVVLTVPSEFEIYNSQFSIVNLLGQKQEIDFELINDHQIELDLHTLSAGEYILEIVGKEKLQQYKLLKLSE